LAAKLDGDSSVNSTDYFGDIENVLTSGAQLKGVDALSTIVAAAIA